MTRSARLIRSGRVRSGSRGVAISPWMLIDVLLWTAMLILAIWMRFDFSLRDLGTSLATTRFYWVLIGFVALSSFLGWSVGLYRGRFLPGSLLEASVLAILFIGVTTVVFLLHLVSGSVEGVPRSTPIIAGAFTVLSGLALRSVVRRKELYGAGVAENAEAALVFGAGDGGSQLVKQLRRSEVSKFNPVAILDDDPDKHHMVIEGVRVQGGRDCLERLAAKYGVNTLIVAVPSLPSDELIEIRDRAELLGLHVLVLPPLNSLIRGRVAADELRAINVDDLLGRAPARLNQTQIAEHLRGKRIMVTGAGGSIGSELCRQLVRFRPAELMMLDRDESGLHSVQLSIQDQAMLDGEDTILASIRDRETMIKIFAERRPQIVFHAAALKHMPLLEHYPYEAFKTNVIGTQNLLEAAKASGVESFVNISTDKAANPCTALGTSKRVAERLTASTAAQDKHSKYASVRFGNVLGSRGSVLTVFEKQIADGGPVTVTDPEVNRYFMTIPEACQLVLQAADVAKTLIERSGKNINIVYTGLRENEKLAEELFDDTEEPDSNERHEALSVVRVAPLATWTLAGITQVRDHETARKWLNDAIQ
jgi:FlaA1/EpsC-like NDP-sugar epimerase